MTGFAIAKIILTIIAFASLPAALVLLIFGIHKKKTKVIVSAVLVFLLFPICMFAHFAVAVKQYYPGTDSFDTFEVTSDDIDNGIWDVKISHDRGEDISPQLSWEEVPGASCYAVYMIDPDGGNWLHMHTVTYGTELASGAVSTEEYIGPYPPSGSHTYVVYVFALKEEKPPVFILNNQCDGAEELMSILNTFSNSDVGNIIAYGKVAAGYPG